jgi:hypothetical protein
VFAIAPRERVGVFAPPALEDTSFDAAFELKPDDEGALDDARSIGAVLVRAPASLDAFAASTERLRARAGRVARADVDHTALWFLDAWRALSGRRLRG